MEKPSISFFAMNFILLFVIVSFIFIVFDLHKFEFVLELVVLLVFIFFLAFAMFAVYNEGKWGCTMIGAALIILLLNTLFISMILGVFETAHVTIATFSVIGLFIALINLRSTVQKYHENDIEIEEYQYANSGSYYPYIDKIELKEEPMHEEAQKIETAKPEIEKVFI